MQQLQKDLGQMIMDDVKQSYSNPLDILKPEVLGPHKHAIQYQIFQDQYSWSQCGKEEGKAGDQSLIQISQKGIVDLEHTYICFNVNSSKLPMSSYLWEVTSYSIGNINVSCNYQLQLSRALSMNKGFDYLSQYKGLGFDGGQKPADAAGLVPTELKGQYCVPLSMLIPAFQKIKHLFIGMGQHLVINLRIVPQQFQSTAVSPVITNCSLAVKYIPLDDNDMGMILKNKVQFPLEVFQCIPQQLATSLTFQLPIAQKDKVRYIGFVYQGVDSTADALAVDYLLNGKHSLSGVAQYRMPIQRISISYGQQNIVLDQSKLKALEILDLCDFKRSYIDLNMDAFYNGSTFVDLSRFGIYDDPHGSEQSSTNLLVTIDFDVASTFGPFSTSKFAAANMGGVQVFGYVVCNRNFILENGVYRQQ